MEERQDVSVTRDEDLGDAQGEPARLSPRTLALLAMGLLLGAALTYIEMYHRFAP